MKRRILYLAKILLALLVVLIFYRIFIVKPEYWNGFYYPNGDSDGASVYSPRFETKEECVGWAINERASRPEDKNVPLGNLWECNKNCRLSPEDTALINSDQQFRQKYLDENTGPVYNCDDGGFDGEDWLHGNLK